ncbi:hypothetical protein BGZ51_001128, partial [Haplosporangium sp. Z 767]
MIGLENILKTEEMVKKITNDRLNQYGIYIEECGDVEKIHNLLIQDNTDIYKMAHIIGRYSENILNWSLWWISEFVYSLSRLMELLRADSTLILAAC